MRSTILRALAALLLGAAGAAIAADSSSLSLPDVPWQKPWARQADVATTLDGMPTACPEGEVLTVGAGGALGCVASGGTDCSASKLLQGGKTYAACCNAGGNVRDAGGVKVCNFSGNVAVKDWQSYDLAASSNFSLGNCGYGYNGGSYVTTYLECTQGAPQFVIDKCPSGWSQYQKWSSTVSNPSYTDGCGRATSATPYHDWGNVDRGTEYSGNGYCYYTSYYRYSYQTNIGCL